MSFKLKIRYYAIEIGHNSNVEAYIISFQIEKIYIIYATPHKSTTCLLKGGSYSNIKNII